MRILNHRIPIQRLINDPNTPIKLKNSLKEVESIRIFAKNNLALPLANNYATYVDLHRPFVVLNLFASKPLSFTPKTWCYPIIGCQSYRGYFDTSMAKSAKAQLDKEGWDTWLGGVSAYSTLGWFDDPLLNTFFTGDEASLAALIFHELSHHILYINGDTTFNESFATAVELEGTRLWLKQQNKTQIASDFTHQFQDRIRFITLVNESIDQLKSLYQSSLSDQEKNRQ
jgi:predicted aminopeptidase